MDWIRAKDLCSEYPIGKNKANELLRQFRAQSNDWIKDERMVLLKKSSFEDWWKEKGRNHETESNG